MLSDQNTSGDSRRAISDRLINLLHERIRDCEYQELVDYVDKLLPAFDISSQVAASFHDAKLVYHWKEFMEFHDEDFIRNAYRCIFRREPDTSGLQSGLQALRIEKCTRVELLGRLRYSDEGRRHFVEIKGLWIQFQLSRLQRIPFLGALVGLFKNRGMVFRPDLEIESLNSGLLKNKEKLAGVEEDITSHYNAILDNLEDLGSKPKPYVPLNLANKMSTKTAEAAVDTESVRATNRRESLLSLPVIGFFLQLPRAIRLLSRMDKLLDNQQREIAERDRQIARMEMRLMAHYNNTLKHLKREMVEAFRADISR